MVSITDWWAGRFNIAGSFCSGRLWSADRAVSPPHSLSHNFSLKMSNIGFTLDIWLPNDVPLSATNDTAMRAEQVVRKVIEGAPEGGNKRKGN